MWDWMCWINLGMFGLKYFIAKYGRLRCVGLDIVEGLVKTVDVFDKSIRGGGGQGGCDISKCALQRTYEETVYSGTEYTFPGLFVCFECRYNSHAYID
jgi:hypothetical protein